MNRYAEAIPFHPAEHEQRALAHQQQAAAHHQQADYHDQQAQYHRQQASYHYQQAQYFRQQNPPGGYANLPPYDSRHTASQGYVSPAALAFRGEIQPAAYASLAQYYQTGNR
ncbi:hypothetical protein [Brevibacillus marinus]|uniref:hypothetical protein n=1 Tax=Brevibacillus marinus TaxID=2496837 RepID=UPI000F84C3A1|nr:hypothetical protein [Brevibacillus marinus]